MNTTDIFVYGFPAPQTTTCRITNLLLMNEIKQNTGWKINANDWRYIPGIIWDKIRKVRQPGRGAVFSIQQTLLQADIDAINSKETTKYDIYPLTYCLSTNRNNRNNNKITAITQNRKTAKYVIPPRQKDMTSIFEPTKIPSPKLYIIPQKRKNFSSQQKNGSLHLNNDKNTSNDQISNQQNGKISVAAPNNEIPQRRPKISLAPKTDATTPKLFDINCKNVINKSDDIILSKSKPKAATSKLLDINYKISIDKSDDIIISQTEPEATTSKLLNINCKISIDKSDDIILSGPFLSNPKPAAATSRFLDINYKISTDKSNNVNDKTLANYISLSQKPKQSPQIMKQSIQLTPMPSVKPTLTANDYVLNDKNNTKSNGLCQSNTIAICYTAINSTFSCCICKYNYNRI